MSEIWDTDLKIGTAESRYTISIHCDCGRKSEIRCEHMWPQMVCPDCGQRWLAAYVKGDKVKIREVMEVEKTGLPVTD